MGKPKPEKGTMHPRNKHQDRYDLKALVQALPELANFILINKFGDESIEFANPEAVKTLNKALLLHYYQIEHWDIPEGYLCPPIPGRADYLHYAADLLASCNDQIIPKGKKVKVLDVGVGANCVYPIIGHQEYGWDFVGSEIDETAVRSAKNIANVNPALNNAIDVRLQVDKTAIFKNIINKQEQFDLTICNPPFHSSAEEALEVAQRKNRNLGHKNYIKPILNFGGQSAELWVQGGEYGFISKMIEESKSYKNQCFWFTSLISKSENLDGIYGMLEKAEVTETRMSKMATGNKITRIIAWSFLSEKEQNEWVKSW